MASRPPRILSPQGQVNQQYLQAGIARGMSANSVLRSLQQAGIGYTRSAFLADYSILQGREQIHERLRSIPLNRRPDPARLPVATTKTLRRYSIVVEIIGDDTLTGNRLTRHVTIASDDILTIEDYLSEAVDMLA